MMIDQTKLEKSSIFFRPAVKKEEKSLHERISTTFTILIFFLRQMTFIFTEKVITLQKMWVLKCQKKFFW